MEAIAERDQPPSGSPDVEVAPSFGSGEQVAGPDRGCRLMPDGKVSASAAEHAVSDAAVNSKQQSAFVWRPAISIMRQRKPVACRPNEPLMSRSTEGNGAWASGVERRDTASRFHDWRRHVGPHLRDA